MTATISEDDYKPAFLSNQHDSSSVDPSALSFFHEQASFFDGNRAAHNVTENAGGLVNTGGIKQVNFSVDKFSRIAKREDEILAEVSSSPFDRICETMLPMSSYRAPPQSCVMGTTVYASPCPPNSDTQFNNEPSHFVTVAARTCDEIQSDNDRQIDHSRTVAATPLVVPSLVSGASNTSILYDYYSTEASKYSHSQYTSMPVPNKIATSHCASLHNPFATGSVDGLTPPFYGCPAYDTYTLSNSSSRLSEDIKPFDRLSIITKAVCDHYNAVSGTHLNIDPKVEVPVIDSPLEKKPKRQTGERKPKVEKETQHANKESKPRKRAKPAGTESVADYEQNIISGKAAKPAVKKQKKDSSPGGISQNPLDPDARRRKENMAFEKGCFVFRISDLENSDEPGSFVWFVENYQLLQKYEWKGMDIHGHLEYSRTKRYSGWLADEPSLYFPAKVKSFNDDNDGRGHVVIDSLPSKDDIDQYRIDEMNKKDVKDMEPAKRCKLTNEPSDSDENSGCSTSIVLPIQAQDCDNDDIDVEIH